MNIQLLPSGALPDNQAVITCEGVNTCDKVSRQYAIDQKEGSTGDSQLARVVERLNCCRLKKVIDKDDKMDCNELIAYWMMEGYLGHVDSVMKAYKKGHEIFMDFKYVRMPRPEFYEKEIFDSLASETTYKRYRGDFYSTIGLGFIDVFIFHDEAPKFGNLVPDNGVIRTVGNGGCSCLLLDGNQLGREVLRYFTESLKHFAYFNPRPNLLQRTLCVLKNLSVLVLRGCRFLEEIDSCIGEMAELTVLEISYSSSIKTIPDTIFQKVTKLRSLNLSYLAIEALPKHRFPKLVHLRWIILRGCSGLTEIPSTREMTNLQVIDLYDATSLKKLSTTNFRSSPLKMLDLSNTHVTRVPCLWNFAEPHSSKITHLILRKCLNIYVFDIVGKLVSLQVLDVSGSKNLKQISIESLEDLVILDLSRTRLSTLSEDSFKKLHKLKVLNLSRTNISSMPPISHLSSLLRLIVQGCESLEKLKIESESLSSLQFLDVSGCRKLEGWGAIPFGQWSSLVSLNLSDTSIESFTVFNSSGASSSNQHLELLQILDLSKTSIKELPSLSHLKSLKQLLLAGCSNLSSVPHLETLTKLEVLDISKTDIEKEFLHKAPSSLRKLLLKDCSKIEGSLPLASLPLLQELDLRGSGVAEFPEDIISARMPHLKCLRLPHKIDITRVDWRRMKDCLPNEIYWDQLNIFESVKVLISSDVEHSMSAKPSDDSHLFCLVDREDKWEAYFKQFHFSVSPKEENEDAEIQFGGSELVFKGHHPLARKVPYIKPNFPSVEIHGFSSLPEDAKSRLKQAVNVALVGNSYISSLSEECARSMEAVEVCWINTCTEMKFVLGGENGVLGGLETLVLSNLTSLKAFCPESENVPSRSIESLKHMYVDCCRVLNKIISASHLPENLETLHIKFCDKLVDVCDGNASECKLTKLYELSLLDLPKLKQIGADLPSLKTLRISQCPELDILDSILQCALSTLTHLSLESCLQLKHVLSSSMLPVNLTSLEIRACDGLTTVFDSAGSSSLLEGSIQQSSTSIPSLPSLRHLQLWNLPNLMRIGGDFPSLVSCEIKYCSRLQRAPDQK